MRALLGHEFVRFVLTGGTAAAVNIGARMLLSLAMPYEAAVAVAYLIGMATAYLLARRFVFAASGGSMAGEFWRFALVNLIALAQVWLVSVGLARLVFPAIGFTFHAETVAHVIGVLSPIGTSYIGHRRFSFARRGA
ncbi:GtrA family protein [Roseococcus sp. SYP-B2431]|uniref:GtrA family protein n=1 Tax=Roseococcus sp. SYP-B2431 TaxID=2496640 RepID=UPI001F0ED8C4|nr:GtrA family protein [Roseococcus sp. SYP-B2431]